MGPRKSGIGPQRKGKFIRKVVSKELQLWRRNGWLKLSNFQENRNTCTPWPGEGLIKERELVKDLSDTVSLEEPGAFF